MKLLLLQYCKLDRVIQIKLMLLQFLVNTRRQSLIVCLRRLNRLSAHALFIAIPSTLCKQLRCEIISIITIIHLPGMIP